MLNNQRPGVFSRVEISGYRTGHGHGTAALLLPCGDEPSGVYKLESCRDVMNALGGNRLAVRCVRLLFEVAGSVTLVLAQDADEAIAGLTGVDARVIVSGFTGTGELTVLRDYVEATSESGRECIAFAGIKEPWSALDAAGAVNSGRVVLCCPALALEDAEEGELPRAIYGACALAAAVLGAPTPVMNFNGLRLRGLRVAEQLSEDEIQQLIRGGVCVLENVSKTAEVIRAVTTHTSAQDGSSLLRGLNTVLIIDDVLGSVRGALSSKLSGSGRVSIEGIRDLVAVGLRQKQDAGIIASFEPPRVRPSPSDPGICLVEISFGVAHQLSQIRLTAFIRV